MKSVSGRVTGGIGFFNDRGMAAPETLHALADEMRWFAQQTMVAKQAGQQFDDVWWAATQQFAELDRLLRDGPISMLTDKQSALASQLGSRREMGMGDGGLLDALRGTGADAAALLASETDPGRRAKLLGAMSAAGAPDRERRDATRDAMGEIIRIRQGESAFAMFSLQKEVEAHRRAGVDEVTIAAWVAAKRKEIHRSSFEGVEQAVVRVSDTVTQALVLWASKTEDLNEQLRNLAHGMLLAFGNEAVRKGISMIFDGMASGAAPKLTPGAAAMGAIGGAGGAITAAGMGAVGQSATGGLAGLLGVSTGGAGAILAGGGLLLSVLAGSLFGSKEDREREVYLGNLKALREAGKDKVVNITLVLPEGPVDFTAPHMSEALREGYEHLVDTNAINSYNILRR
jgi:hypothetical protein